MDRDTWFYEFVYQYDMFIKSNSHYILYQFASSTPLMHQRVISYVIVINNMCPMGTSMTIACKGGEVEYSETFAIAGDLLLWIVRTISLEKNDRHLKFVDLRILHNIKVANTVSAYLCQHRKGCCISSKSSTLKSI